MIELTEQLWQYLDISSIITILTAIITSLKYGKSYINNIQSDLQDIGSKIDKLQTHNENMETNLLRNDIKLLIKNNATNEEVLEVYDIYKDHGGNSYIDATVQQYIKSEH